MSQDKQSKNRLWGLLAGVSVIGALYGWFVYAGEIDTEVSSLAQAVSEPTTVTVKNPAGGPDLTVPQEGKALDPKAVTMLGDIRTGVESVQNEAIKTGMYFSGLLSPEDTAVVRHFSNYCMPGSETGNCSQDPLKQFGDTKISSILSGNLYSAERSKMAQDYLDTLLTGIAAPDVSSFQDRAPVNADLLASDPALKKKYAEALSDESILSIIRAPFAEMIAKRTAPTGDGTESEMMMMEKNAIKRFLSADWNNSLVTLQGDDLQKELAKMQAYQIWLEYQRYRQTERVEALLATLALQNIRNAKKADKQFAAATAGPSKPEQQ